MITIEELSQAVYEDVNGRIVAVNSDDKSYRVFYECDDVHESERRRRFELVFENVQESTATPSSSEELHVLDDHPLLWQHNDEHAALYFSSAPSEPFALIGQLFEAHRRLLGGWRELAVYLHASADTLLGGNGLLARGPKRVIDEYARVIGDQLRYSVSPGHSPRDTYRVVLFDECFVICRSVSVVQQGRLAEPEGRKPLA